MSEYNSVVASAEYAEIVREVFIDPIKSVIVIDDEFPSLDSMLSESSQSLTQVNGDSLVRVREILRFCRQPNRRWMVEISNGQGTVDGASATMPQMHLSDLLILDYHLDPKAPVENQRAIDILKDLNRSDRFNLIVLYTKGYGGAGGEIARVATEIGIALTSSDNFPLALTTEDSQQADELVGKWDDESDSPVSDAMLESIDDAAYLSARSVLENESAPGAQRHKIWSLPQFAQFRASVEKCTSTKLQYYLAVAWAMREKHKRLRSRLNDDQQCGRCQFISDGNCVRTDRVFVAVVSKSYSADQIPDLLLKALTRWNPEPHRLLMSRMRHLLDSRGVLLEREVLASRFLQAGWLSDFLDADPETHGWRVRNTILRHWERLGDQVTAEMLPFADRMRSTLPEGDYDALVEYWTNVRRVRDRQEITVCQNIHACSKPVEGHHLQTGHVFTLKMGDALFPERIEYWLCLSPACDLVPGQKESGWAGRLRGFMAFKAVELHPVNLNTALSRATAGNSIFFRIGDTDHAFDFVEPAAPGKTPNPRWEQMIAGNSGRFTERTLSVHRVKNVDSSTLSLGETHAEVVAQLRYEYALNLLQRLASSLSRVGLDFVDLPPPKK